jgi:hypothetical protein
LYICSTSYGWKKGRESNWQFDSQPLKVENRLDPDACRRSATHHRKALEESYKFALNLISIRSLSWELWAGSYELPKSRDKKSFKCKCRRETQRILYGGRWWLPPSLGRGESNESVLPMACPKTRNDSESDLTNWLVGFYVGPNN